MPKNEDDEIWVAYAKGVKPLGRRPSPSRRVAPGPSLSRCAVEGKKRSDKVIKSQPADFHAALDHNLERRLRQGSVTIDARIDLHGMYQKEAHEALSRFIAMQIKAGRRCLLIITGKGHGGEGVLRANISGWLSSLPGAAQILALRPAAIKHGGGGAFYVMLKKRKE